MKEPLISEVVHPANIKNRIEVIDVLRGFALLGISLRHFISRFDYEAGYYMPSTYLSHIDKLIEMADTHFLLDKTYPIFALLFGFSMFLVVRSYGFTRSFKRLLALIPFACLNSLFFPAGDILGLYTIVGLMVLLMVRLPLLWIVGLSIFFLLQPLVWVQIFMNFFDPQAHIIVHNSFSYFDKINETIAEGNFLKIMWVNLTKGQIGNILWSIEVGRLSQTIGLILLGYYLGKSGKLVKFLNKGVKCMYYLWIPGLIIIGDMILRRYASDNVIFKNVLLITSNWAGMSFSCIYIILVAFIYNVIPHNVFSSVSFYGRMSLTNYILQSIIGVIVFAPFAFNGVTHLSNVNIVVVFIITALIQFIFSKQWLAKNRYGPFEFYWRRLFLYKYSPSV